MNTPSKYTDEIIGKAIKWQFEEHGYVDISDTYSNELDELVEKYLQLVGD